MKVAPETVMMDRSCGAVVVEDPCFVRNLLWGEWWVKTWLTDSREVVYMGKLPIPGLAESWE